MRSLRGMELRPTADRLREALFNVLTAGNPQSLTGSTWLDLFAGTGAVGIEALSRGAKQVIFVEAAAPAARVIRQNLESLGITAGITVSQGDVLKSLPKLNPISPFDFVFLDPPYDYTEGYERTLQWLGETPNSGSTSVGPKTIVIAEHRKQVELGQEFGTLRCYRKLSQGDAALSFYRKATDVGS